MLLIDRLARQTRNHVASGLSRYGLNLRPSGIDGRTNFGLGSIHFGIDLLGCLPDSGFGVFGTRLFSVTRDFGGLSARSVHSGAPGGLSFVRCDTSCLGSFQVSGNLVLAIVDSRPDLREHA